MCSSDPLAAEVTRVTLEVGSQGKLGGQAHVPDVEGVWLNLVRNVSWEFFLFWLRSVPGGGGNVVPEIKDGRTDGRMIAGLSSMTSILIVGFSFWQVNRMCSSLTDQVRSIAVVTTAVARGDLTQKIEIQVEGEMSTLKGRLLSWLCWWFKP